MTEHEIKRYEALNAVADKGGIVILGGSADKNIPLCELKQAFALSDRLYNRSFDDLTVADAREAYRTCAAPLAPERVLLHLGTADLAAFTADPAKFDQQYRALIAELRADSAAEIVIISHQNPDNAPDLAELNRHLAILAESEHCAFGDISTRRLWNPRETKEITSFIYSLGFVHPLKQKKPVYDLVKILFCSTPVCAG